MAQSIFDALSGVSLDGSSVQSLLDSQTLISEVEQSAINQDEEDIFQCGKCKSQFTSLHLFVLHKREHTKLPEQKVDLSHYLVSNDSHVLQTDDDCHDGTHYNPEDDFNQDHQLGESIILEENDILFSMEQEGANYLASDSGFNVPIILNSDGLEPFANSSLTGADDNPLSDDVNDLNVLENDINQNLEDGSLQPTMNFDITEVEDSSKAYEDENKTYQMQNLKYKCSYCHKQFAKKFYWQQHERSHTGEKPYQCVVCGRPFAQKSNVKKHMSSHKVWPGTAIHSLPPEAPVDGSIERSYHCQFCKEIFDSYKALKGHLIVSHLTLKVYKCVQYGCGSMFAELEDFLEHTRSHKRSEYRCHVCGDTFNTLTDLGLHQYTHSVQKQKTTEKYYCCSVCKSSFSNLEALQHHTETTTHDYACPHCGKSFLIERFLRRHLKTHASSARFACEDCGKAFKTEQYLANHKLIHSEETPFLCPHCPARFKRKDRLGRHMLIHDLTKRLKCPFRGHLGCMSEFSRPDKLKRHLLTHSNIKRFSCGHCNRHFHRAQALKHHELNKHSLKCDICSHAFKTKDQLLTHNCDQSNESKKHVTSQLPKKACGSFKPRRPTPKRQVSSKTTTPTVLGTSDKDNNKAKVDEHHIKNVSETLKLNHREDDFDVKMGNIDLHLDLSDDSSLTLDSLKNE
ncbi:PREDICTED: zinc finger protein 341-like [Ceratosolen solmsi marchali]|uniref:Zinc finger protein 341-like n=1 Tax=Ceratosolen solmsi marchali TaxID=326594 RepID=A0AAJ7E273_9HYME|nr:PREDICTED: zinc finger protein 341-like [Ceratosolen solmsi marchali]